MSDTEDEDLPEYFSVLVTGANSGLGLAICRRLIDEFLHTRSSPATLLLIPSTRSQKKADETVAVLREHVSKFAKENARALRHLGRPEEGLEDQLQARVEIEPALMDLCRLASVQKAVLRLRQTLPGGRLDILVNNAGIGGWTGLHYGIMLKQMFASPLTLFSRPWYKVGGVGWVTKAQVESVQAEGEKGVTTEEEEQLGEVFCANVFGHYMLLHWLAPALVRQEDSSEASSLSRVIWVGSLEAYEHAFSPSGGDFQGLKSNIAYESTKRLTDLLVLNSEDPANDTALNAFYQTSRTAPTSASQRPKMYITQPGYFISSILESALWQVVGQYLSFLFCRLLGSVWHTTFAYSAATSVVWLILASQATLDKQEASEGKAKWGAAVGRGGSERCLRTEVEGYGYGGRVGEKGPKMGRHLGVVVTEDGLKKFKQEGNETWEEMERLRKYWDRRLRGTRWN